MDTASDFQRFGLALFDSRDAMDRAAADLILAQAGQAIAQRGHFTLALSGGSTPTSLYALLATEDYAPRIDWDRWLVLPGDERLVPMDDERSNLGMAGRFLLDVVPLPRANILAPDTLAGPPQDVADGFEHLLAQRMGVDFVLDVCLLGMGPDGHTASLFPDRYALHVRGRSIVAEEHPGLDPRVARVSLSLEAINRSRLVLFLAAGQDKEARVRQVLATAGTRSPLPAAQVTPRGDLHWFVSRRG